jgi:hypothetical protein
MLKQGARADEGAVLLGLMPPEPPLDEGAGALTLSTGKKNGPKRIRLPM